MDRKVSQVESAECREGRTELDTHADTGCAGSTARIIEYTGKTCDVAPFSDQYESMKDIPIVKAGTAYDDPRTGVTYILIMSQALYFGLKLTHSLLCPNQLRTNGVVVDDVPCHPSNDRNSTHSIYFPREDYRIPLDLFGCISYIPTRSPTTFELDNCEWLDLTADDDWDPHSPDFKRQEEDIREHGNSSRLDRNILSANAHDCVISSVLSSVLSSVSSSLVNDNMIQTLEDKVMIRNINVARSKPRKPNISKEDLSLRWGIGLETAKRTLNVTTQKCIRNAVHPLHRRYRTKQQQLRYNQLSSRLCSDTMFSFHKSIRNNSC
ncbi:MAG: hypothetical protein ACREOZ_03080 [Gloeomargaritales cyanobacterium]